MTAAPVQEVVNRPTDHTAPFGLVAVPGDPPVGTASAAVVDAGSGRDVAAGVDSHDDRRHGWVWAALAVFWLLALGAGLITLASLGAPRFLCTGSAAKGLACQSTGTVIAAVLTVVLIVLVGSVSVLVIEARAQRATALRGFGVGVVVLVVVATCGYLLIRTIGG